MEISPAYTNKLPWNRDGLFMGVLDRNSICGEKMMNLVF